MYIFFFKGTEMIKRSVFFEANVILGKELLSNVYKKKVENYYHKWKNIPKK